jgi:hypothetical protein
MNRSYGTYYLERSNFYKMVMPNGISDRFRQQITIIYKMVMPNGIFGWFR